MIIEVSIIFYISNPLDSCDGDAKLLKIFAGFTCGSRETTFYDRQVGRMQHAHGEGGGPAQSRSSELRSVEQPKRVERIEMAVSA